MKKAKFFLSLRKFKTGYSIVLQFYYDIKNRKEISTNIIIQNPDHWDEKRQLVKTVCPDSYNINKDLTKISGKADHIINDFYMKDKELSADLFARLMLNEGDKNKVYDFILCEIDNYKGKFAKATLNNYTFQRNKLNKFRENLLFSEIDISFIKRYERYLLNDLNNNKNTANKSLKFLKQIINKAKAEGLAKENPFINFPLSREEGKRTALNSIELQKLIDKYKDGTLNKAQLKSLKIFLFSCFTGLRIGDTLNLKFKNIHDFKNADGSITRMIDITQGKTKVPVKVPIISTEVLNMLNERSWLPDENIFGYYKNGQTVNKHLKDIAALCSIDKNLHNHIGRHTFATTYTLNNGISLFTVSKMLGHTEIKTTQIYAKLSESMMITEMNTLKGLM